MRVRQLILAALLVAVAAVTRAQQPAFKSGVDLVRFDVRVVDANGRPITDLRQEEIEIVEGRRPLPVVLFQRVTEPAGSYVDEAMRVVTAEISSNDAAPRGHLYILIFDQQHITPGNENRARLAAAEFIRHKVRPSDRVAIYGVPAPGPQLNFTADRNRAIAELEKVRGAFERLVSTPLGMMSLHESYEIARGSDRALTAVLARFGTEQTGDLGASGAAVGAGGARGTRGEDPAITRRLLVENARTVTAQADAASRQFLMRMSDVIRQYRTVEGRKIVALFSEGFNQENVTRDLEAVAAAAAQSYCVFYSIDLNARGPDLKEEAPSSSDAATEVLTRIEPLGSLAAETDGVLINHASDHLRPALERIADQAQDYYIVGFASPQGGAVRDRYHRVRVSVSRPGATVSARTGYSVGEPAIPDRKHAIDAALAAPFAQHGLPVSYTTYQMRSEQGKGARVYLSLTADLPRPAADPAPPPADVVFVVRDASDGRVVASGTDTMRPIDGADRARYRVQFDVDPGTYLMRAVVREAGGLVGTADRRLEVRTLAGPDVSLSDIFFASAADALPVRPRALVTDTLTGFLEIYGREPGQLATLEGTAELVPMGSDTPLASGRLSLQPVQQGARGPLRRAEFSFPLGGVAPGHYVVRTRVRAGGESAGDVRRQVEVWQ